MTTNFINRMPFLRTSREFPEEMHDLTVEINKSYVDIALAVNDRTIGIFPNSVPAITGEAWFLIRNQRQMTFRQVYVFTTTAAINHEITIANPNQFTRCWGSYTDGTNNYGIIWGTTVAIAGQITFYVTATQIVFVVGGGAPALVSGRITLEWLGSV